MISLFVEIFLLLIFRNNTGMGKNVKKVGTKKKLKKSEKDSIAELKEKLKHQKDALNKIIKTYSE